MPLTDLRTAAARHFLGLSSTDYLVDVAHAALDHGIYAHGLGEIATARQPIFADIAPLFDSAMRELELQVLSWEQAIDLLAVCYMVSLAEGENTPLEIARQVHDDYCRMRRTDRESFGPLVRLVDLYYQYDYYDVGYYDVGPVTFEHLDRDCLDFAEQWCRDRWLPVLDPAWLTSTVVALARGICEESTFDLLPILADALQDAGCDSDDILYHCRGPGPHVRGCWVVDLVLGKE